MTGRTTLLRVLAGLLGAGAVTVAPEFVPVAAPDGGYRRLDELVADARATRLEGWDLVADAQRRVHDQFLTRSYRQPWRSPASAFRQRAGYVVQYNLALRQALRELGFEAELVFAARVRTEDAPWWRMGHVWVRVRYGGRTKSCCARHSSAPGELDFSPLSEPVPFRRRTYWNVTIALMVFVGVIEWGALLRRRPLPAWLEAPF